jgi:hypothetical protein
MAGGHDQSPYQMTRAFVASARRARCSRLATSALSAANAHRAEIAERPDCKSFCINLSARATNGVERRAPARAVRGRRRCASGASGFFSFSLEPNLFDARRAPVALAALCERRRHFGVGYSWGGYESLIMPARIGHLRKVTPWTGGPLVRVHIGLEDPEDLIADLQQGFEAMEHARES